MTNHRPAGFTLIEVMIVVVIMAIIAAVVYPNYTNYVRQARRSDAQVALQNVSNQLEKYFGNCNTYTTDLTDETRGCPGDAGAPAAGSLGFGAGGDLSPERHYLITIAGDNSDLTCDDAGNPCAGMAGGTLAACLLECGYSVVADPDGAGTTGSQTGDGKFRIDSRGKKHWDRNDDDDYLDANEDKWR
jgi:prepilin-type N-terminal cleavage/methylation domain-containing protein